MIYHPSRTVSRFGPGSGLEGSDPHELAAGFEVCQMKGTHIAVSELTLFNLNPIKLAF